MSNSPSKRELLWTRALAPVRVFIVSQACPDWKIPGEENMSSDAIPKATPFDAAVAEVQAKIEELRTTLMTLLRLQAEHGGSLGSTTPRGTDTEISHDTFFNMTIGEAAKKYLSMVKTTKSTADIAEGLERGGLKHSSKDFATTVRSILGPREDFTRVPNGDWGLTEWYPGIGRGKKAKPEKQTKSRPPKSKAKKPTVQEARSGNTRRVRILETMKTDLEKAWTAGDIAKALGESRKYIQSMMVAMMKDKELVKDTAGGYRLPTPKAA
jgi:hypothetical protein